MSEKSLRKLKNSLIHQVSLRKVCCDFTIIINFMLNIALSNTYIKKESSCSQERMIEKALRKPKFTFVHQFSLCKLCFDYTTVIKVQSNL